MNKIILKIAFLGALLLIALFAKLSIVSADGAYGAAGCVPVYGGGVQCPRPGEVLIDKKVRNPSTGVFVDNLGLTDPKYRPLWIVAFRIYVKNPGDQTLSKVTVSDRLPSFVDYVSGPASFDSSSRTVSFDVKDLAGGSTQTFDIKVRVVATSSLPAEKNVICPVNVVDASADSQKDHDESQFCLEKQLEVPTVPAAGPEHWLLSLGGLGPALLTGLYLRKKANIAG